jgi:hypothetical protein
MDKNERRKLMKVVLAKGEPVAITALRLAAWTNGYTPIPNRDKRTLRTAWNLLEPDEAEIRSWLHPRAGVTFHPATGLLIVGGLATVDCDLPDHDIAQAVRLIIRRIAPQLFEGALERGREDGSPKFMLFCRRADGTEPFTIQSKKWSTSPDDVKVPTFQVEIFASERNHEGKARRQVGAFGPHTIDETGVVKIRYQWRGPSPADTPLADLPVLTEEQALAIAAEVDQLLEGRGLKRVFGFRGGKIVPQDVYDLDDTSRFDGDECGDATLEELIELYWANQALGIDMRVSGSFLDGPAVRMDRCHVGWSGGRDDGHITVHDYASEITHRPKSAAPFDHVVFAALLSEAQAAYAARQATEAKREEDDLGQALEIWEQSRPIRQGSAAGRYLAACGVEVPKEARQVLRAQGLALVALVADLTVGTGSLVGVEITTLSAEGIKLGRKVIGETGGGVIMLSPIARVRNELAIVVGFENGLALRDRGVDIPIWALLDVQALAEFPVLPRLPIATTFAPQLNGLERLTIITDGGKDGAKGAATVRARWEACGLRVRVRTPRVAQ